MGVVRVDPLSIQLRALTRPGWRAARELLRAWEAQPDCRATIRLGRASSPGPGVVIEPGSLVTSSLVIGFDVPFSGEAAEDAAELALTTAAWDTLEGAEGWRRLSAPIGRRALRGRPDFDRPWAVAWGGGGDRPASPPEGMQLHVVGGLVPPGRVAVWWPAQRTVTAAVLGRVALVLDRSGPLAWDAQRAGIPLADPPADRPSKLAGLVPETLLGEPELWQHVVEVIRRVQDGAAPPPLMTERWVTRGRDRAREAMQRPASRIERARRRYDKLWRDPDAFLRDSRFVALRRLSRRR